jgi:hypothetical protein
MRVIKTALLKFYGGCYAFFLEMNNILLMLENLWFFPFFGIFVG